jgi:hypothetical protein
MSTSRAMKKIRNAPASYVEEMLDGLCVAHRDASSGRIIGGMTS